MCLNITKTLFSWHIQEVNNLFIHGNHIHEKCSYMARFLCIYLVSDVFYNSNYSYEMCV